MATYHVSFLSRNEYGQFKRRSFNMAAADVDEAKSYVRHGHRNGKWALEGPIEVTGPIGHANSETHQIAV